MVMQNKQLQSDWQQESASEKFSWVCKNTGHLAVKQESGRLKKNKNKMRINSPALQNHYHQKY